MSKNHTSNQEIQLYSTKILLKTNTQTPSNYQQQKMRKYFKRHFDDALKIRRWANEKKQKNSKKKNKQQQHKQTTIKEKWWKKFYICLGIKYIA